MARKRLALILAAALLPACHGGRAEPLEPTNAGGGPAGQGPPADEGGASWSRDVWPILQVRCRGCHTAGEGAARVPDMRMTDSSALYDEWVRIPSRCNPNLFRVLPGDLALSFVWDKVAHPAPLCGQRMPLQGAPLTDQELEPIRRWIEAGALRN